MHGCSFRHAARTVRMFVRVNVLRTTPHRLSAFLRLSGRNMSLRSVGGGCRSARTPHKNVSGGKLCAPSLFWFRAV